MTQNLKRLIQKIDEAKTQLDQLRPIKPEYNSAICQKFQLEFNYHSNHIEGNTLTLGETKNLILRGMEVSIAKKFRDILEMKGHLDAYDTLGFLTERVITEDRLPLRLDQSFIKNLHKIIFVEDKQIHSEDDGVQSVTVIPAGEYKKHQNHVITNTGAKFEYAEPWQVPQMTQDLLDWYNNSRENVHPIILASIFHYKFIRIHPFGDGNGRTARLLMNLILQSSGHVIAMVKSDSESKGSYLNSLSLVDNNFVDIQDCILESDPDLFDTFINEIGNCLLDSYGIMIRGAKGEDITDAGDIIKLAEIREIHREKANLPELTFNQIFEDEEVKAQAEKQLRQLEFYIREYSNKVLSKIYSKNHCRAGKCYTLTNEFYGTDESRLIFDNILTEIVDNHFKISLEKTITHRHTVENWPKGIQLECESLVDTKYPDTSKLKILIKILQHENCLEINVKSQKVFLDFIDPDFESKAKQIIKLIDDQVVKKIN